MKERDQLPINAGADCADGGVCKRASQGSLRRSHCGREGGLEGKRLCHSSSLLMCTALALSHVVASMQACTCCNRGVQKADDTAFPIVSCGSPPGMSACLASAQEKDQNRVRGMRIMLERQTRAAGAAASADSEDAAKAAAEAQLLPPQAAGAALEEAAPSGGAGAAASSSAFAGDHSCACLRRTPNMLYMCARWVCAACLPHSAASANESVVGLALVPKMPVNSLIAAISQLCSMLEAGQMQVMVPILPECSLDRTLHCKQAQETGCHVHPAPARHQLCAATEVDKPLL